MQKRKRMRSALGIWRQRGESDMKAGATGRIQGVFPSQKFMECYVVGTDRRVVMLQRVTIGRRGAVKAKQVYYSVPWEKIVRYYADDERFALIKDDWADGVCEIVFEGTAAQFGSWKALCESRGLPRHELD